MKQRKTPLGAIILIVIITVVIVAGGIYWWQTSRGTKSTTDQNVAEQIDSAKVITEAKQNTKTYSSSQFNYSFEYSKDWFLTENQSIEAQPEVILISKQKLTERMEPNIELSITVNRSSLEENIRDNLISREEIMFTGQPATKINFTGDFGPPIVSILIPQNNYTFVMSYDPADQDYAEIEKILNSFSFTE
jgi:hypothetical protein